MAKKVTQVITTHVPNGIIVRPTRNADGSYKHDLPRWVHKDGGTKIVSTPDECDEALTDGWEIHPGAKA